MAKKSRRSISTGAGPRAEARSETPVAATSSARPAAATRSTYQEFNPDYTPVISDLKKIGILAGTFITILVVLSFFLR
jgi:hypothetical protein